MFSKKMTLIAVLIISFFIGIYIFFNQNNNNDATEKPVWDTEKFKDPSDKPMDIKIGMDGDLNTHKKNKDLSAVINNNSSWVNCDDLYDPTDPDEDSWREYMTCRFNNYHFVPTDDD